MPAITRREFLSLAAAAPAAVLSPALSRRAPAGAGGEKPNILWISCEDISPNLGCYGDKYARTPNLDRFAAQGCRYTNVFTVFPVCAPNRSGIITGMYPTTIGTMHMRTKNKGYQAVPPANVKCFTEYLRAAGYYCTNCSKTDYQFGTPFTAWDESSSRAHWRNRPKGKPFFSVINLTGTHESKNWAKAGERLVHNPAKAPVPPYLPDTRVVRENFARYYDNITGMDKQVAKILKDLSAAGLADSTVVFFWSDHGAGLPRGKRWIYDSGIHVPLIVRRPGVIKPGTVCDDMISSIDLGPTVLSLAGVKVPDHMQGRPFLADQKAEPRRYIHAARCRMDETYDDIRCVRDKKFKYIRNYSPEKTYAQKIAYMDKMPAMKEWRRLNAAGKLTGPQKLWFAATKPREELYDITVDPHEVKNLASDAKYKDVLERMRAVHEQWTAETGDLGHMPEPQLIRKMWPSGKQPQTARCGIDPPGGKFSGPVTVTLTCRTQGASIGWTADKPRPAAKGQTNKKGRRGRGGQDGAHWTPYTGPFKLLKGATIRVKAIRYGYKTSAEARAEFGIG